MRHGVWVERGRLAAAFVYSLAVHVYALSVLGGFAKQMTAP
jgi:hypothetical protein